MHELKWIPYYCNLHAYRNWNHLTLCQNTGVHGLQSSHMHKSKDKLQKRPFLLSITILAHTWIEIKNLHPAGRQSELQSSRMHELKNKYAKQTCRCNPHACMNWNWWLPPVPHCHWRCNPRACMNWNSVSLDADFARSMLQSSRIHELKLPRSQWWLTPHPCCNSRACMNQNSDGCWLQLSAAGYNPRACMNQNNRRQGKNLCKMAVAILTHAWIKITSSLDTIPA